MRWTCDKIKRSKFNLRTVKPECSAVHYIVLLGSSSFWVKDLRTVTQYIGVRVHIKSTTTVWASIWLALAIILLTRHTWPPWPWLYQNYCLLLGYRSKRESRWSGTQGMNARPRQVTADLCCWRSPETWSLSGGSAQVQRAWGAVVPPGPLLGCRSVNTTVQQPSSRHDKNKGATLVHHFHCPLISQHMPRSNKLV